MANISEVIKRIAHIGIDSSTPESIIRKVQLSNLFSFSLFVFIILLSSVSLALSGSLRELDILRMTFGVVYSITMLFNMHRLYSLSRFYLMISPTIMMCVLSFVFGAEPVTSLLVAIMPLVILPVFLFGVEEKKSMIFGIIWLISTIYIVEYIAKVVPLREGCPADIFSNNKEINLNIYISLVMFVLGFMMYQLLLNRAEEDLFKQQDRVDTLLKNILPEEIIPQLKESSDIIAEHYGQTSILFADIANFTPLAARLSAQQIVRILNEIFSYFDNVVDRYELEKIKTIGDCYMAASGVPRIRDDHAKALVNMALDLREYIQNNTFHGESLGIRMGISSGPVIAGVIGRKKFIYDLWGDVVSTASRMESQGKVSMIQITEDTKILIEDEFECKPLGVVPVKGKGEIPTFEVVGKKVPEKP